MILRRQQINNLSCCTRFFYAFLMIILFPLFLALLLLTTVIVIVIATLVGFFCGPAILMINNDCLRGVGCLLYPLLMVFAAIAIFIFCLFSSLFYMCVLILFYFQVIGMLISPPEVPEQVVDNQPNELYDVWLNDFELTDYSIRI